MTRSARIAPGGMVFHALNRRVDRRTLFRERSDYRAFETVLREARSIVPVRICAYALMPNHWHLVLWPVRDGELSTFMHRVTVTHVARWKAHYGSLGEGHLYQDRFKSFPVESNDHYLTLVRYVERNALRAGLVERAEDWPFTSLWRRDARIAAGDPLLSPGPIERPSGWIEHVNEPERAEQLESIAISINRGTPYGTESWRRATARELGIESSLRARGRPKKDFARRAGAKKGT